MGKPFFFDGLLKCAAGIIGGFQAQALRNFLTGKNAADAWTLTLGDFTDEAWLLFRANEGVPGRVTGGQLTCLTGELYLLKIGRASCRERV